MTIPNQNFPEVFRTQHFWKIRDENGGAHKTRKLTRFAMTMKNAENFMKITFLRVLKMTQNAEDSHP